MPAAVTTRWIARWRDRLRRDGKAEVEVSASEAAPVAETAGPFLVPRSRTGADPKVLMCLTLGLRGEAYSRVIDVIDAQKRPDLEPLIVTDQADFDSLRLRNLLFEYFPSPESQAKFAPDRPWALYRLRRLTRLRQKWAPVRIVAFGASAQAVLEELARSPFEDETITQVIGASKADRQSLANTPLT